MKLKSENGIVSFLMKAGDDMVCNTMPEAVAKSIVDSGKKLTDSVYPDYSLCVDDKWFFPVLHEKKAKTALSKPQNPQEGE